MKMTRTSTGITQLDTLIEGGLPQGRSYLLAGEPGTGKTIFSLQFLLEGLRSKQKCLYIAIDEKPEEIIPEIEDNP